MSAPKGAPTQKAAGAKTRPDSLFRRILRVVLSKTFAFAVLMLLQLGILVVVAYYFTTAGIYTYVVLTVITLLVLVAVMEQDDMNPAYKMLWMLIILVLPATGALFYLLWGHGSVPRRKRKKFEEIEERYDGMMAQAPETMEALAGLDEYLAQNARYLARHASAPVYPAQRCEYYPLGEDFFVRFLDAVRNAKKTVFMEYYIYQEGVMLDTTLEVLRQKAAEGVDVRVVWDGFGSLFTLPPGFEKKLRRMGIKAYAFSPLELTPHLSDYAMLNHRDHRKIAVIDGETAFSGGLNFADEYINAIERFGQWKDTAFMVQGEAVFSFTTTFLRTWDYVSGETSDPAAFRPPPAPAGPMDMERGFVQPYCDTPLDSENVSENAYLNIIRSARRYVHISTPYLILDQEMITYLTLAAKSGIDVRILTPGIPDKPKVFLLTRSYYPVLLRAGVRIYEYTPGFNHAKMYVSDDRVAIVGSANMDFRSLYLHFENCAVFYGGRVVGLARDDMAQSFAKAREVTLKDTARTSLPGRLVQIGARFLAPMM